MRISDWSSDVCSSDLINQMVVMRLRRRFIARAAVAEIVAVEDARLFEQADGAIDGGDGDAAVERRGAFIERLDIGMIRRIRDYARDDSDRKSTRLNSSH